MDKQVWAYSDYRGIASVSNSSMMTEEFAAGKAEEYPDTVYFFAELV